MTMIVTTSFGPEHKRKLKKKNMRTSPKQLKKSNAKNNYCLNKCTCHTLVVNDENNVIWQVLVVFHKIIMTRKLLI